MSAADAAALIPPRRAGVRGLREAANGCRACPLWRDATQTVFGGGRARAPIMLVGEQPGDREDRSGGRSSAPRVGFSTRPWPRPASTPGSPTEPMVATFHPSSVMPAPTEDRDDAFAALVDDLRARREAA